MTAGTTDLRRDGSASDQGWRLQEHRIALRGATYRLRLVRFPAGWLASVDTVEGPTLGWNASPYLAVSRAIEPLGGVLIDAMSILAALDTGGNEPRADDDTGAIGLRNRRFEPLVQQHRP